MSPTTNIILLGAGKVGREIIHQIQASGLPIRFCAIADSQAFLGGDPLTSAQIRDVMDTKTGGQSLETLPGALPLKDLPRSFRADAIVVDTSASRDLDLLPALHAGCKLVFANKNAHSAAWEQAVHLFQNPNVRYEATVGAGLPVIQTLRSMLATGDLITRIEGVMSGTLGFLCSQLEAGLTYSQAINDAFASGYTEPDPRDDLSGFDVARKALILARTAGWPLEQKDLQVEPFFDISMSQIALESFFQKLSVSDSGYQKRVEEARLEGKVLRYIATITPQSVKVGLKAVEKESSLGALNGPGNFFAFYSQRFQPIPMVISGPGAGVSVTAAGVFGDILDLINHR